MTQREKRLGVIVLGAGVVIGGWRFVWPALHKHFFSVTQENERLADDLDNLYAELDEMERWRHEYRSLVERTGGTNVHNTENDFKERIGELVAHSRFSNHRLTPLKVGDYRPPGVRAKTGIQRIGMNLKAEATLSDVVNFLQGFYELPYLSQATDVKLVPISNRRGKERDKSERVQVSATLEAIVLPAHPVAELNEEQLKQPAKHVKYSGQVYAMIAQRDPFNEYVPPPPPPKPKVEVKRPERPKRTIPRPSPPPPKPVGDPDRTRKFVRMVLSYATNDDSINELYVFNTKNNQSEYVRVDDELDGGKVVLVHPLGAVTHRKEGDRFLYPVGKLLSDSIEFSEDGEAFRLFPELVYAYRDQVPPIEVPEKKDDANTAQPKDDKKTDAGHVPGKDSAKSIAGQPTTANSKEATRRRAAIHRPRPNRAQSKVSPPKTGESQEPTPDNATTKDKAGNANGSKPSGNKPAGAKRNKSGGQQGATKRPLNATPTGKKKSDTSS